VEEGERGGVRPRGTFGGCLGGRLRAGSGLFENSLWKARPTEEERLEAL
jgi:hypothetical protein